MKYKNIIGILTYSKKSFLDQCLESVIANSNLDNSIIVVANNSENEAYIREVEDLIISKPIAITTLNFRKNRGTSAAWNAISKTYHCENVAILNDDIYVHKGWDWAMEQVLNVERVGVAGFSLINGWDNWHYRNMEEFDYDKNKLSIHSTIYPPGCFLMFKKYKFDEVGGFDENLWIGLEEVDFSVSLMKHGFLNYQIVYDQERYKFANHYGGGTTYRSIDAPSDLQSIASQGTDYFQNKHKTSWPLTPEYQEMLEKHAKNLVVKWRRI